jgi:hypothetical protein
MFTWLNKQGVKSDAGFEVQFAGRFDAGYREAGKVMSIYVESGIYDGQPCIILNPDAFHRWDGDKPGIKLPADERERIQQTFMEAMLLQGLKTVVESGVS